MSVVIPELVTTIVSPVPTDFPKSVKDPKTMEVASQYAANCGRRCSGALKEFVMYYVGSAVSIDMWQLYFIIIWRVECM